MNGGLVNAAALLASNVSWLPGRAASGTCNCGAGHLRRPCESRDLRLVDLQKARGLSLREFSSLDDLRDLVRQFRLRRRLLWPCVSEIRDVAYRQAPRRAPLLECPGAKAASRRRLARPVKGYTQHVLRFVAVITLAAFTLLVGADRICCPDGCTDRGDEPDAPESVPHSTAHTCVLCVLGVEAPAVQLSLKPLTSVSAVLPPGIAWLPVGTPLALDHPPRNA